MRSIKWNAALCLASGMGLLLAACGGGGGTATTPPSTKTTPTVSVTASPSSITTAQLLQVTVNLTGGASSATPTGTVTLSSGTYTSATLALSGGSVSTTVPAHVLAAGIDLLNASYTPDSASSFLYNSASDSATVTVRAVPLTTPTVTATPGPAVITTTGPLLVTVGVSGDAGDAIPTGTVALTSGTYSSAATLLSSGSATFQIAAGTLAAGTDMLKATYTPDAVGSTIFSPASGTGIVTVTLTTPAITVTPASNSITTTQPLTVTVGVSGGSGTAILSGTVTLSSGTYTSSSTALSPGGATFQIAAGILAAGTDKLIATYTPDAASAPIFSSASATGLVAVTLTTPTVTLTPASTSILTTQALPVTVAVTSSTGSAIPAGTIKLTSGTYTSAAANLSGGTATITIPASTLTIGSNTLVAAYTPDAASTTIFSSASGTGTVAVGLTTPTVTVTPATTSITTTQPLVVTVAVTSSAGSATPTGTVMLTSGTYASTATNLNGGIAAITVPASILAAGSDTVTAMYSPDGASSRIYNGSSGTNTVTVAKTTPTVTVTPSTTSIASIQTLSVTVAVSGGTGDATPTGTAKVTSGTYVSAAATLIGGQAILNIPAGSLATGTDVLTTAYTPDVASSPTYNSATGTSVAVTVADTPPSTVSVDQSSTGPEVSDQLLGMNLGAWYDVVGNASDINAAFDAAGIREVRWPGGSWSDDYHWGMNSAAPFICGNTIGNHSTFVQFLDAIVKPTGMDLALTANYGDDITCNNPGDPAEAAAWITAAVQNGVHVSHMTVGNEEYGSWESDHHAIKNDPTTYADAVGTASTADGYYSLIKAADPTVLVGVDVNPGNSPPWDSIVLAKSNYDFVEYHYYPQAPGSEDDTTLVHSDAQQMTSIIDTIKSELTAAGNPNTPIYIGEIGSVYTNPGKQSWSITQGLYAGQVLGESMNSGVSRLTWWMGFGDCNGNSGNMTGPYGWQTFGAYNVFSDGSFDGACPGAGPIGTMSPTARAFQLFSNVALNGESVLSANVSGDKNDVRAYAATHSGGTALVLFNLNETTSEPVIVQLSTQVASSDVTVITYDKAIYDQTNAVTPVWADPATNDMGAQNLPLTLYLTPWSMNVVIIK